MAHIAQSRAYLRIYADDLVPDEITQMLGCLPTKAQTRGDRFRGDITGTVRIARFGMWVLRAPESEPEDLDGQIQFILSQLTHDLAVWAALARSYKSILYSSLFMGVTNEGMMLSPESLSELGSRGIMLGLDVYAPRGDVENPKSEQQRV